MDKKATVSVEWLSGCSGCEVGIVDLHEKLLTVLQEIDLVRIPILMDIKDHPEADIGIITGCVRTEHDREAAQVMRQRCQTIIAFGTCAVYGGPQGAAYAHTNAELLDNAYVHSASTTTTQAPVGVTPLLDEARPLDTEIPVDLYLPGCPPHAAYIFEALMAILRNRQPTIGRHTVCYNCRRVMKKTGQKTLRHLSAIQCDQQTCFLSQGVLCFGSVTLDRCLAPCPASGVPCFSCGGPSEAIILEPQKDVRSEIATRMSRLTEIPCESIVAEIESQAKTHFAYAMASAVFRQKPTFLLKKWMKRKSTAQ